jgi:hypothetical protein
MRKPPGWWGAVLGLLLVLWIMTTLFYRLGAEKAPLGAADVEFGRQHDFALFRVGDGAALLVTRSGFFSVVKYGRGTIPFCPICGVHESRGSIVNLAGYAKGDWIYSDYPNGRFAELYNTATGERVDVEAPEGASKETIAALPAYRDRGLDFDDGNKLDGAVIKQRWSSLSTINESCVIFTFAFLLLAGVWLVVGAIVVLRRR